MGGQGGGKGPTQVMQWSRVPVVVWNRLVVVKWEVNELERYFEGKSQDLVRLDEEEGPEDDVLLLARISRRMLACLDSVTEGGMGDQEGEPGLTGARDLGSIWSELWSGKSEVQN